MKREERDGEEGREKREERRGRREQGEGRTEKREVRRGDPTPSRQREHKTRSSKLGRSVLQLNIGFAGTKQIPKTPRDHQEGDQESSKTLLRPSSAVRIEEKRRQSQ